MDLLWVNEMFIDLTCLQCEGQPLEVRDVTLVACEILVITT